MPKKQMTAGKQARAATRKGEKYTIALRRLPIPEDGSESAAIVTTPDEFSVLAHRDVNGHPPLRPFRGSDLYQRIGAQRTVDELVDRLYEGLEHDQQLRPLFPRDLVHGREMQKLFFTEWLGGPRRYSEEAHQGLRYRHVDVPITRAVAGRWLGHFRRGMETVVSSEPDRTVIFAQVRLLAQMLVNGQAIPTGTSSTRRTAVATCGVGARIVKQARDLARLGDVEGLRAILVRDPDLLHPSYAASIMHSATLAGRTAVIEELLDQGANADHPFHLPVGTVGLAFEQVLFVTPLCAARMKRRSAAAAMLIAAGAHEDVFTSAFLGDTSALAEMLAADPTLAQALDPAVDVLDLTPVEHAVAGRQAGTLRLLLEQHGSPLAGAVRSLRAAAAQGNVAMVELLLAHGADATRIGVGRWVLHPELAPLLSSRGAAIDSSGSWIGASCTGNQGRKDDPDFVRALLRHGARADDRRRGESGVEALHATALHYAAKAGLGRTIEVLLEHGADPGARDARGRTPADWLEEAAPSVHRADVRTLLSTGRR